MKTAIQFSGGKDSLAVMYLMRDRLNDPDVTVYFGDTGNIYPHMRAKVTEVCERLGARLKVVPPPIPINEYQAIAGLPADIVPVEASVEMQPFLQKTRNVLLQSNLTCCARMLWLPMQEAIQADGVKKVIRGAKKSDGHVGVPHGHIADGITYESPIWDWSDDDVFGYLREVGAELPIHYAASNNSADCIFCTAYLTSEGARARLEWTKKTYPEMWPVLQARLKAVKDILDGERAMIDDALSVGETDGLV